mmetsp:Transcript_22398/g.33502  ORF Transcript_22398/g.33502 Transcript_22398/m.33502 type:complete len:134 (+) Transcript_22398:66-467(+)
MHCLHVSSLLFYFQLSRTNQVFSFRRKKVEINRVVRPFLVVLILSITVLIIWTAINPLAWVRMENKNDPLATSGKCKSVNFSPLPFFITLMVMIVMVTISLLAILWQTKDIQDEFVESNWIFYGILAHLQVCI